MTLERAGQDRAISVAVELQPAGVKILLKLRNDESEFVPPSVFVAPTCAAELLKRVQQLFRRANSRARTGLEIRI